MYVSLFTLNGKPSDFRVNQYDCGEHGFALTFAAGGADLTIHCRDLDEIAAIRDGIAKVIEDAVIGQAINLERMVSA